MEGDRLEAARTALQSLLAGLDDDDTFCLIGFHATSQVIVPFSRVGRIRPLFAERFASLQMGTSTALAPALTLLAAAFTPIQSVARRRLSAVIVSDGKVEDAVQAAAARSLLPANLTIAALGIGTDYDHNLLAHICGNTRMVDHLDNPVQAIEAFNRYVTLYGHTLTANTRLHFRPATGVLVNEVTAVRHVRTIPLKDGVAAIDDLPAHGKASYLVKFLMTPASTGLHALAGITLKYDLPGHALSDLRFDVSITIEVTTDPVMANATNPDVMQAIRLVMAGKMVESAELHIEKGDSVQAKATLRQATRRYQEAGALQQADDVARFLDALPKVADEDQLTKSARGLTKRVTE
jgi:Mg-chelatase subunit ChlD